MMTNELDIYKQVVEPPKIYKLLPSMLFLLGRMVMAPSAAHSWSRTCTNQTSVLLRWTNQRPVLVHCTNHSWSLTGWILAPQESEPIQ